MRIAIIADIHGNSIALDAVLKAIEGRGGVDAYWVLGDLCAIGYNPVGVLERLTKLPNALFVRGNVDRFITTGDRPFPTLDDVRNKPELIPLLAEVSGSFGWTQGCIAGHGWLEWLANLPFQHRLTLPDGTRVLLVHSTPHSDDDTGLNPTLTDDQFRALTEGCEADLICVGHFHMPIDRRLDGLRVINPGSISNNFPPDLRAAYAILTADENGYQITFHRVAYDLQAVIDATQRLAHPGAPYIISFAEGKIRASWLKHWDGAHAAAETR